MPGKTAMNAPFPSRTFPPTAPQLRLLRFIAGYIEAHDGVAPTLRECASGIGMSSASKSSVHAMLLELERRGAIRRLPGRHQAIELCCAPSVPRAPDGAPLYLVQRP